MHLIYLNPMKYDFMIAALGASAGGLQSLNDFFDNVKINGSVAYVVNLHSPKNYVSNLVHIIRRHTVLEVEDIQQGTIIEPDKIYLQPPNMRISIKDGVLFLEQRPQSEIINRTIDHFYNALAEDAGQNAIGVIMSGTGSDGTQGFHAIEQHNGVTIVQDPATAAFDGMPLSSIKYDHPTYILHPRDMPTVIDNIAKSKLLNVYQRTR